MKHWCRELSRLLADLLEYPVQHPGIARRQIEVTHELLKKRREKGGRSGDADAAHKACEALGRLLAVFETQPLQSLRRDYVAMFDLFSECGLDMAGRRFGVSYRMERARNELNELYRDCGFVPAGLNCPDYLPLMLEFLSVASAEAARSVIDGYGLFMNELGKRVEERNNVYRHAGACLSALAEGLMAREPVEGPRVFPHLPSFAPSTGLSSAV